MRWEVTTATERDLPAVLALVEASGLPPASLGEYPCHLVVARAGAMLVGSAAIEVYGQVGLLRSVAVAEAWRGWGVGAAVVAAALDTAASRGLTEVYLLTETAPAFFEQFGFVRVDRAATPEALRQAVEFATACPVSAQVMVRTVVERHDRRRG